MMSGVNALIRIHQSIQCIIYHLDQSHLLEKKSSDLNETCHPYNPFGYILFCALCVWLKNCLGFHSFCIYHLHANTYYYFMLLHSGCQVLCQIHLDLTFQNVLTLCLTLAIYFYNILPQCKVYMVYSKHTCQQS